jgi:hypothetical protein
MFSGLLFWLILSEFNLDIVFLLLIKLICGASSMLNGMLLGLFVVKFMAVN